MKKIICFFVLTTTISLSVKSQVYYTKNGNVSFFSKSVIQDIEAENNQVISVLNTQSGELQFSLLSNAFHFPKAKMEEDFNENYIESNKYPRSTFKGKITNLNEVDFSKDGSYKANVTGNLTIHGVTKNISTPATISVNNGDVSGTATFHILVKDYKIEIPSIVSNKVAENIEIKVNCNYQKK